MALNLSEAKSFDEKDYEMLMDYIGLYYKRSMPRFYESPLRLLHQPHVFKWIIIDEHLCIIKKRQIMGTPVCYLLLPPLGPNPVPIMRLFQSHNITTLLSEEDLEEYNLSISEVEEDKGNAEYCYDIEAFADRKGINKNQLRRPLNKFERLISEKKVRILHYHTRIPIEVIEGANQLTTRWLQQRGKKAWKQTFFIDAFNPNARHFRQMFTAIFEANRCLGYLISEMSPNGIINNTCCTDYENNPVKEPTLVLLHHQAVMWKKAMGDVSLRINRGAAVRGSGSKTAKKKLRPIAIHQNYKLRTEKLTKEAFDKLWNPPRDDVVWL